MFEFLSRHGRMYVVLQVALSPFMLILSEVILEVKQAGGGAFSVRPVEGTDKKAVTLEH